MPRWELFARRILDSENIELFLSGSSALMLSREVATSMRGRAMEAVVSPFSLREALRHAGNEPDRPADRLTKAQGSQLGKALTDYLACGGFPEAQGLDSRNRMELLGTYVDVVLLRDVLERHNLSQPQVLRRRMSPRLQEMPRYIFPRLPLLNLDLALKPLRIRVFDKSAKQHSAACNASRSCLLTESPARFSVTWPHTLKRLVALIGTASRIYGLRVRRFNTAMACLRETRKTSTISPDLIWLYARKEPGCSWPRPAYEHDREILFQFLNNLVKHLPVLLGIHDRLKMFVGHTYGSSLSIEPETA